MGIATRHVWNELHRFSGTPSSSKMEQDGENKMEQGRWSKQDGESKMEQARWSKQDGTRRGRDKGKVKEEHENHAVHPTQHLSRENLRV